MFMFYLNYTPFYGVIKKVFKLSISCDALYNALCPYNASLFYLVEFSTIPIIFIYSKGLYIQPFGLTSLRHTYMYINNLKLKNLNEYLTEI